MAQAFQDVSWEAEEYIVRDRNSLWYVGLLIIGVGLSAIAVWQNWWTFLIVIILCIITVLTSNLRPPRRIKYTLTKDGLIEGTKLHKYEDFKAFGILKEGAHFSAVLIPKKRFALSVKVYFPGDSGEGIVDALGSHLPMEEVKLDFLDKVVNFLRI
ncbi:hypothetical protein IKF21_02820 [Candidatus Saccharibacteria bacterium]|nr:hypothetical protein [Candidatus Saccharibacteria bacterium]